MMGVGVDDDVPQPVADRPRVVRAVAGHDGT
jgi:hypothetical protein